MRTTVTLDPDVEQSLRRLMREQGTGFKETVNAVLRRGLRSGEPDEPYEPPTFSSGVHEGIDLDKALRIVGELEDAEFVRRVETGK